MYAAKLPTGSDGSLVLNPQQFEAINGNQPLRVAFFGPWNYDNGLGSASRELLCALRRVDARINIYPIFKPFHVHRLVCPAVATIDFAGQADIAIVHLNPDSWHLLTDEQLQIIHSAKQRIGYWVWETDRLPPAWQHNLHSVDRIWAPSQYCADTFAAEVNVPVDVVPHPVKVPVKIASDRAAVMRRFGIDPARRVILFIFDGASYLVRKNPEALIRAFAASGLLAEGWMLLLKTKHLYDRPEAGRALAGLVAETPGVMILEASLHADEMTSLLAAADIYASPHCSEGFGLTIAEAMAVGKPVVATDYAGTRDFLVAGCGYPVASSLWTLDEDHGHYLAGHAWGRVDETALAAALVQAAQAVARGDTAKGEAAKANIARLLSYDAVQQKITASFAATIASTSEATRPAPKRQPMLVLPEPPQIEVNLSSAPRFDKLAAAEGVVPVALAPDLSWSGAPLPGGEPDDWLFFAPQHAGVSPDAIQCLLDAATHRPDVVLFYADDVAGGEAMLDRIRLKPDFDLTLLVSQDYIGAPVFVRRKALAELGGLKPQRGSAVLFDLVLRVAEAGGSISRISRVLIGYTGKRPVADPDARRAALADIAGFREVEFRQGATPDLLAQRRTFKDSGYPAVSIIIPTRRTLRPGSRESYVERLLEGIAKAAWPMAEVTVIVGDDVAGEPEWARRPWPFALQRIETARPDDEPFNYARKMNQLWRSAQTALVIFMNDDVCPARPDWLAALASFACDESVGGVGARLYYEDGSIQHVGMFPAFRTAAHAWAGWPASAKTYQDWAVAQREWSMVTGAIFATRRSVLEQLNGFDEKFSLEFNDVDLCLRIRNLGYRIVYNPEAEFTHAEKASRGETLPPGAEVALFLSRWSEWLRVDPASHPGLAQNRVDLAPEPEPGAWYSLSIGVW